MPNSYEEWKGRDHELYIARLLAKFTETNRPIAAKYVAIRRLHGLAPSSLYIYANALH